MPVQGFVPATSEGIRGIAAIRRPGRRSARNRVTEPRFGESAGIADAGRAAAGGFARRIPRTVMPIVALGLNHTTAPLDLRERASIDEAGMGSALRALHGCPGVHEAAILSTCNRTDLYCGLGAGQDAPTRWFDEFLGLDRRALTGHLYVHREDAAVRHVMRVASGLDSMVLGEPQILGQLKQAYGFARRAGSLGTVLDKLFQRSFSVAKRVRTDTAIGASPVSVAFAAVTLAQRIFGDLDTRTALLVGAGETIELCARHLSSNRIGRMVIANRTLVNARRIATALGAYAISLGEVPLHLSEADVVVSSTGSREPIITVEQVRAAVRRRRRRPMFMADLAVPHDVERGAGELPDVYLYTVDDLGDVIEEGRQRRVAAAGEAEGIIDRQVTEFMAWMRGRRVSSVVVRVRESAARRQGRGACKSTPPSAQRRAGGRGRRIRRAHPHQQAAPRAEHRHPRSRGERPCGGRRGGEDTLRHRRGGRGSGSRPGVRALAMSRSPADTPEAAVSRPAARSGPAPR